MKSSSNWLIAAAFGLGALAIGFSFVWPVYDWDLRLPSPDGRYDLVVLRGDAAAPDDFFYNIYLFPHAVVPQDREKGAHVWLTPVWRGKTYLVYSGYNYPMFRWTSKNSIEIELHEAEYEPYTLEPVKRFTQADDPVHISVVLNKENNKNVEP